MKFKLLNELAESRLFRYEKDFRDKSAKDLAHIFFAIVLLLELLRHKKSQYAREYANRTISYSDFVEVKPGNTDLYNIATVLTNQEDYDDEINVNRSISVPELQFKRYLRDVASGNTPSSIDKEFLIKLENYLSINDAELMRCRRTIAYWESSGSLEKENTARQLMRSLRARADNVDLYLQALLVL